MIAVVHKKFHGGRHQDTEFLSGQDGLQSWSWTRHFSWNHPDNVKLGQDFFLRNPNINRSQGQTFGRVCICLYFPVFAHRQLYFAMSRVGNPDNLNICFWCYNKVKQLTKTKNQVFKEVYSWLTGSNVIV
jgi:hypothetical protein